MTWFRAIGHAIVRLGDGHTRFPTAGGIVVQLLVSLHSDVTILSRWTQKSPAR
jgi:hypothetical protein